MNRLLERAKLPVEQARAPLAYPSRHAEEGAPIWERRRAWLVVSVFGLLALAMVLLATVLRSPSTSPLVIDHDARVPASAQPTPAPQPAPPLVITTTTTVAPPRHAAPARPPASRSHSESDSSDAHDDSGVDGPPRMPPGAGAAADMARRWMSPWPNSSVGGW